MNSSKTTALFTPDLLKVWDPNIHDKGLLFGVSDLGFDALDKLSGQKQYNLEKMEITSDFV